MKDAGPKNESAAVILYDGVCGLCDRTIRFVLKRDRGGIFCFAALQSPAARRILARHGIGEAQLETFYLVRDIGLATERVLGKSSAALCVLSRLEGPWRLAGVARVLPETLRDRVYDAIARRRYRIWGKYDACPQPDPMYRHRFLDASRD
jgi:predicted DCC family thiol-disulfide oxidoreductase YuxK